MKKLMAMCLAVMMIVACFPSVYAATVDDATIDMDAKCSLTIWKFDITNAMKDGVWTEETFPSTGWRESYVEEVLGEAVRHGDDNGKPDNALGNGQNSNGYAIKGVQFSVLKVADVATFTESVNDGHASYNKNMVLYGFDKVLAADLLEAIGLGNGAGRYENADNTEKLDHKKFYYTSDTINEAMAAALADNATVVKNAMEAYVAASEDAIVLAETNENGKTIVRDLPVGLYVVVETAVPEMVTTTTPPFFISLPMTSVSGNENSSSPAGGTVWNYDPVVYPKNHTGIVTLEKTVRESNSDTGKNDASDEITDGFQHTATGSAGDTMEYQIISTLPSITSHATSLSDYHFVDSISEGLTYDKDLRNVKIEFFTDKSCENKVTTWTQGDGKFDVEYSSDDRHMTVNITKAGLDEINGDAANVNGEIFAGYSNYTLRLTYTASIDSDNSFIYGDDGNDNIVVLQWKRTSNDYYDTLIDDCHVFSYGIDLVKLFSKDDSEAAENNGMFKDVHFKIYNKTDGYWVTAERSNAEGIYYVTGHAQEEADATVFYPVTHDGEFGHILVKGCEDDEYILTEIQTSDGYTLLKDGINVTIESADDPSRPCEIYKDDVLGVLQNDPHYDIDGGLDLELANIPQKGLAHSLLTANATVDGNAVEMLPNAYYEDAAPRAEGQKADLYEVSPNAIAPLSVVNTRGFDLPSTGDHGTMMYTISGILIMTGAAAVMFVALKKKKTSEQ